MFSFRRKIPDQVDVAMAAVLPLLAEIGGRIVGTRAYNDVAPRIIISWSGGPSIDEVAKRLPQVDGVDFALRHELLITGNQRINTITE